MNGRARDAKIRATYARLVDEGLYTATFRHSDIDRHFVAGVLRSLIFLPGRQPAVLDVGCGAGDWLDLVRSLILEDAASKPSLFGFDLTPELVDLARRRLARSVPESHLRSGSLFDTDTYAFGGASPSAGFDLVYAYDVIQQIPPREQARAVLTLFDHVRPGGQLVIIDQDADAPAGRRMAIRKAITRYLRIPLVPRYYLVARYPRAIALTRTLSAPHVDQPVVRRGSGARFALVATRPG